MRRLFLLTVTFAALNVAQAQDVPTYLQGDARDANAISSDNTVDESAMSYLKTFGDEVNKITQDSVEVAEVAQKMNLANKCEKFVDDHGFMNQWGEFIDSELTPAKYPYIYAGPKDLKAICPAYSSMDADGRKSVVILVLENMANYESSCNPRSFLPQKSKKRKNGAPNGVANGLLALHKGHEGEYDKEYDKAGDIINPSVCRNGDSSDPVRTLRCALSMLNLQIEKGNPLFDNESYWAVLRLNQRDPKHPKALNPAQKIILAIKAYQPCHLTATKSPTAPAAPATESKAESNTQPAPTMTAPAPTMKEESVAQNSGTPVTATNHKFGRESGH